MTERGNYLSLYYKNGKVSFWTGDLSKEEPPEFEIEKYDTAMPKPDRAFPYNLETLRKSLCTYGPAVRYPIVHLEMIRMHKRSIDTDEPGVPPIEGMSEFVASSYPEEVRDAMRAAIRVVQTTKVTCSTFTENVEQLAMSVAVMYQEPKLRKALEESDPQIIETLLNETPDDLATEMLPASTAEEPFVDVAKEDAIPPKKKVVLEEVETREVTTGVMQLNI